MITFVSLLLPHLVHAALSADQIDVNYKACAAGKSDAVQASCITSASNEVQSALEAMAQKIQAKLAPKPAAAAAFKSAAELYPASSRADCALLKNVTGGGDTIAAQCLYDMDRRQLERLEASVRKQGKCQKVEPIQSTPRLTETFTTLVAELAKIKRNETATLLKDAEAAYLPWREAHCRTLAEAGFGACAFNRCVDEMDGPRQSQFQMFLNYVPDMD